MAEFLEGAATAAETAAEVGCLESIGCAACFGTLCSCCVGDGSAGEAVEFACLACCVECLGCAACARVVCGMCCCCCPCAPRDKESAQGYAPLAEAPQQDMMAPKIVPYGYAPANFDPDSQQAFQQQGPMSCQPQGYMPQDGQYAGNYGQPQQGYQQYVPQRNYGEYGAPQQGYQDAGQNGGEGFGSMMAAGIAGAAMGALADEAISDVFD